MKYQGHEQLAEPLGIALGERLQEIAPRFCEAGPSVGVTFDTVIRRSSWITPRWLRISSIGSRAVP